MSAARLKWYRVDEINPEPWTAPGYARGKTHVRLIKDSKLTAYQKALAGEIERLYPPGDLVLDKDGPIGLRLWFWRSTAHGYPADATNLQKATEDALQGVLFPNDRQVVRIESTVVEQAPDVVPVVIICLYRVSRLINLALEGIPRALMRPHVIVDQSSADHLRRTHFDPREVF